MRTAIVIPPDAVVPDRSPLAPPAGTTVHGHYRGCFGCGDASADGLRMQITMGEGLTISSAYAVTAAHQGAPGLAHGGVLGVAIDEMLGSCGYLLGTATVTARMEIDYVRPVPVGVVLHLESAILAQHGRKVYVSAEGRLGGPDGAPALTAAGLLVIVGREHFTTHGNPEQIAEVFGGAGSQTPGDRIAQAGS